MYTLDQARQEIAHRTGRTLSKSFFINQVYERKFPSEKIKGKRFLTEENIEYICLNHKFGNSTQFKDERDTDQVFSPAERMFLSTRFS